MSEAALAPLSTLWTAMRPRAALRAVPVEDVAAVAEARGYARGYAEAESELAPLRDVLTKAVAALEATMALDAAALQPLFTDLVTQIASAVVDGELRLSGLVIEQLVASALAAIEVEGAATLYLSTEDAEVLGSSGFALHVNRHSGEGRNPGSLQAPDFERITSLGSGLRRNDGLGLVITVDPELAPGDLRIETADHVVSASLSARLAAIVAGL